MMMTQVLVSFGQPGTVDVKLDVDLTMLLGSPERYYEVATESTERQQEDVKRLVPRVVDNLQLFVGKQRLQLQSQRAQLRSDIRNLVSRSSLAAVVEKRLDMHVPNDTQLVILTRPPRVAVGAQ